MKVGDLVWTVKGCGRLIHLDGDFVTVEFPGDRGTYQFFLEQVFPWKGTV